MVVPPALTPVARPVLLIVATEGALELQVTELVRFCVLESEYVPVAVNCCVLVPDMEGDEGVTAIDTSDGQFWRIGEHPEMGAVHFAHLTLHDLARYFPETLAKIRDYQSMAIIRDPRDRFFSAIFQRLREFRGIGQSVITREMIEAEARTVKSYLESDPERLDLEHVHFNRQCDFIELGGQPVVHRLFSLDRMGDAARGRHDSP